MKTPHIPPRTARRQARFLAAFRKCGTISAACRTARVDRKSVFNWRKTYPEFEENFLAADDAITESLEAVAMEQAKAGNPGLMTFLLKARRPEKYRERLQLGGTEVTNNYHMTMVGMIKRMEAGDGDVIQGELGHDESTPTDR